MNMISEAAQIANLVLKTPTAAVLKENISNLFTQQFGVGISEEGLDMLIEELIRVDAR